MRAGLFCSCAVGLFIAGTHAAFAQDIKPAKEDLSPPQQHYSPFVERKVRNKNFAEGLYWGDTHLHYSYSTDAGMIGSTDAHTSVATTRDDNYWGKMASAEPSADRWKHYVIRSLSGDDNLSTFERETLASGLAGVWARENTRADIFDAMQAKEVFATTGTRIAVRFFGGWDYAESDVFKPDAVSIGYSKGVPMGGDLPAPEGADKAPIFMVGALKDSWSGNLDRIQIIKGWIDENGARKERVYDVAVSDGREIGADGRCRVAVGNTVDEAGATYTNNIGDAELRAVWRDPDFEPSRPAFYYARVLEIPTPTWQARDAKIFGVEMPKDVPLSHQERAYTSPIWYTPAG